MRIVVVGGVFRAAMHLAEEAVRCGHSLEWHDGSVAGTGSRELKSLVGRADVVLVVTDVASHRGVETAKREARSAGRKLVLLRSCSASRLRALVAALGERLAA